MIPSWAMRSSLVLVILAACNSTGGDDAVSKDAPTTTGDGRTTDAPAGSTNTSCANPLPTTTPGQANISGVVTDGSFTGQGQGLGAATLDAFHVGTATSLGTVTSESTGIYTLAATGGQAVDFLQLTKSGYLTTNYFPRAPLGKSTSLPRLPMFTSSELATVVAASGVTQNPSLGVAVVTVTDCTNSLQDGAIVSAPAGTTVKYLKSDGSFGGTSTDTVGLAMVFNIPAGSVTIGATVGGALYHEHAVTADSTHFAFSTISEQ